MKTMTCRQLGGPCDFQIQGGSANDIIKAQDKHLKEMVAEGDAAHEGALKEMKGRSKTHSPEWGGTGRPSATSPRSPTDA